MIGIDTNVLVRLFVEDSPDQTRAVLAFLAGLSPEQMGYVGVIVVVEFVWVLQRSYGFTEDAVYLALDSVLSSANVEVEEAALVQSVIDTARRNGADLADVLIAFSARDAGATKTVTFDKNAARRIPEMELLA